jgi:hypothetical protein
VSRIAASAKTLCVKGATTVRCKHTTKTTTNNDSIVFQWLACGCPRSGPYACTNNAVASSNNNKDIDIDNKNNNDINNNNNNNNVINNNHSANDDISLDDKPM